MSLQRQISQRRRVEDLAERLSEALEALVAQQQRVSRLGLLIDTVANVLVNKGVCSREEFQEEMRSVLERMAAEQKKAQAENAPEADEQKKAAEGG